MSYFQVSVGMFSMGREAWDCLEGRMSRRVKQKMQICKELFA